MYTIAYIDRTNFSFAMAAVQQEFGLSSGELGLASGVFFAGYVLFQIPGGYLGQRWSARKFVFWCLLFWGAAATLCGLARSFTELLVLRFCLGMGQGGVWPATAVLLAEWFEPEERARANGVWVLGQPVAMILSSPLSGLLLDHHSWRTMFVVEGLLPVFFAAVWWRVVEGRPPRAGVGASAQAGQPTLSLRARIALLADRNVGVLAAMNFAFSCGLYGLVLWMPTGIASFGELSNAHVGLLTAVPFLFAGAGALYNAHRSDKAGERRWHGAICCAVAGLTLGVGSQSGAAAPVLGMALLCLTYAAIYGSFGPRWALMTEVVPAQSAGLALGLVSGIGNIGGICGPYLFGALRDRTGDFTTGAYFLSGCLVLAGILILCLREKRRAAR
jgi:sugar phosphate permease